VAHSGQIERYDCECNGTANLFVFLEVHRRGRVKVSNMLTCLAVSGS
jgi:hypothetical protein